MLALAFYCFYNYSSLHIFLVVMYLQTKLIHINQHIYWSHIIALIL